MIGVRRKSTGGIGMFEQKSPEKNLRRKSIDGTHFDLISQYKEEMKRPGNFDAAEELTKLYVLNGKAKELKEFVRSLEKQHADDGATNDDLACKIGILHEHHPEEHKDNYNNAWTWYCEAISNCLEKPDDEADSTAFDEALLRSVQLQEAGKGIEEPLPLVAKARYEALFKSGVTRAAYSLGQLCLNDFLEGDTSEAMSWFEKGKAAGDKRCEPIFEKLKLEAESSRRLGFGN